MTVQNTANFVDYVGDDVTTSFIFTFRVDDVSWLSVDFTDDFDTFLVNLDQEASPGGSVEYLVAPPSPGMGGPDPSFRVTRVVPANQNTQYTRYDPFDSESHENALDKLTMILQDQVTVIAVGDAFLQAQVDANLLLITTGVSPGHHHVVADIDDFGLHTDPTQDENITGQWDFVNTNGIRVFDAGFVNGIQFAVRTGYMEALALGAVVGFRSNGALQITELGVVANSLTITHDGVDGQIVGANMGDINITGITGRLTQGAETFAYLSETMAGNLPTPTVLDSMLKSDGVAFWVEAVDLIFQENVDITGSGQFGNQIVVQNLVEDFTAITFQGSTTNGHLMYDESTDVLSIFAQNLELSSGSRVNCLTNFNVGSTTDGLTIETIGGSSMRLTTATATNRDIAMLAANGARDLHLTFGTGLMITEKASPHTDIAGAGQFWVRNTLDGEPVFTDDQGVTSVLNASASGVVNFVINADINTATPPTTEAVTAQLLFRDLADDDTLASLGFAGNNDFFYRNLMRGGESFFTYVTAGGVTRNYMEFNPGSVAIISAATNLLLRANNTESAVQCNANASVDLYHNNILTTRTALLLNGGLEVDNDYNGATGFERVLTASDVMQGLNVVRFNFSTGVGGGDPGAGGVAFNNATPASITQVDFDDTATGLINAEWLFPLLADGDVLTFRNEQLPAEIIILRVSGVAVDQTGFWEVPVTFVSGTIPSNSSDLRITWEQFSLVGGGAGITVTGTPVNNQIAVWTAANDLEGAVGVEWDNLLFTINNGVGGIMLDLRDGNTTGGGASAAIAFTDQVGTVQASIGTSIIVDNFLISSAAGGISISASQITQLSGGVAACQIPSGELMRFADPGNTAATYANIQVLEPGLFPFLDFSVEGAFEEWRFTSGDVNLFTDLFLASNRLAFYQRGGGVSHHIENNGTELEITVVAQALRITADSLKLSEQASPGANLAGYGQYWVRSASPTRPEFRDDTDVNQLLDPSMSEIVSVTTSRTLVLTDKGKTIGFTGSTVSQIMTIPASGSVAYQIGTFVAFDNTGSVSFDIAITTDTLRFADDNSTGTRTLAAGGYAIAQKVTATEWKISGAQLT